jgi:hypothetical protein
VIYRHQVCKQADVVLALLLLSNEFTLDDKRRDFDFYERVTTHDSSLSSCIFSIVASEVGYRDKAYAYFMETARLDLDNTHGNTEYGVHTAAMAGTWLGVAYGFGGMRLDERGLRFAPVLPENGAATASRSTCAARCWKSKSMPAAPITACCRRTPGAGAPRPRLRTHPQQQAHRMETSHEPPASRPSSSTWTASSPTPPVSTTWPGSAWPTASARRSTKPSTKS